MTNEQLKLFEDNQNLVYFIYNKLYSQYYKYKDDIIQQGFLGLTVACKKYDGKVYPAPTTYFYKCIDFYMKKYVCRHILNNSTLFLDDITFEHNDKECIPYTVIEKHLYNDENTKEFVVNELIKNYYVYMKHHANAHNYQQALDNKDKVEFIINGLYDGMTQAEIATKLNISKQAVNTIIKRFRKCTDKI